MSSAVNFARIGAAAAAAATTIQDELVSGAAASELSSNSNFHSGGATSSASGLPAASAQVVASSSPAIAGPNDLTFRICLVGDENTGKTSFRACTAQILQTRPDVAPSVASTCYPYVTKIRGGGRMQLDAIDFGPAAEREMALVRRAISSSMFVIFVNLSIVKQKVDKGIFSGRTDTVIMHSTVKESIKKWINLCYLVNPLGCPVMIVGTHKDVLSVQDELGLLAVLKEMRSVATQAAEALSHSATAANKQLHSNCSAPRCHGCYAVSCVDHSVSSENPRDGPKTIKQLWQFMCELGPKLADRAVQSPAELCLRSSLTLLKMERGLRSVLLHDLFLFSLTQGVARSAMRKALRRRRSLGDLSLTTLRRGGAAFNNNNSNSGAAGSDSNNSASSFLGVVPASRVSLALIDLNGTCRLLSTLDLLRRRLAALCGAMEMAKADAAQKQALKHQQQQDMRATAALAAAAAAATTTGGGGRAVLVGNEEVPTASSPATMTFSVKSVEALLSALPRMAEEKGEERLFQALDEVLARQLSPERRDEMHQRGVVAWEVLRDVLAPAFISGKAVNAEEKAALCWQMCICSGYLVPCVSTLPVADCLLMLEQEQGMQQQNSDFCASAASAATLADPAGYEAAARAAAAAAAAVASATTDASKSTAAKNVSSSSPNSSTQQHNYFIFTLPVRNAPYSSTAFSRPRTPPKDAVDQITPPTDARMLKMFPIKFHHAVRRVVLTSDFHFSTPSQLFALFVGRLVNVANVCVLCPDHVYESAAWLRDRNNQRSSRLLVSADARNDLSLRFVSCAELPLRAHAAFMVEVLQSVRAVFDDFELWRLASWVVPASGNDSFVTPKDKFASGPEDMSRLDLAFGASY